MLELTGALRFPNETYHLSEYIIEKMDFVSQLNINNIAIIGYSLMNEEKIMPYFENDLDDTQYYRTFELIQNFKYFVDNTTYIYESL